MIRALTRFSLTNPIAVVVLALLIAAGGVFSSTRLQQELMPDIALPVIAVITPYPNASPEQVGRDITEPLEKSLGGVEGVKTVTSTSMANVSEIELELTMSADLTAVEQKVQQIVNQVPLPSTALKPNVQKFSFNAQPVVYFTVASNHQNNTALRDVVHKMVIPSLESVPGVASIQTGGAQPDFVSIQFNPKALHVHQLTYSEVLQTLQADNVQMPLGAATISSKVHPVELEGVPRTLDDVRNIQIPVPPSATGAMSSSFNQLETAVGELGSGVQTLGHGIGQLQLQNQLLGGMQTIQGQLFGAQLALATELGKPPELHDVSKIVQLQSAIQGLTRAQASIQAQLQQLQSSTHAHSSLPVASGAGRPAVMTRQERAKTSSTVRTVRLGDLANVRLVPNDEGSLNRTNGQESVFLGVVKTEDANTVDMAVGVNRRLAELSPQLPKGMHFIPLFDSSTMVKASVTGMLREAILGAVFAVIVILLFLRNWKTTLIAVVSIPLSLLTAVILLRQMNVSLNIMTLGGMAVATGRVVDDSIVVIENTYRAWQRGLGFGKEFVLYATGEVAGAITSSTITTVAVFLPLGLVSGIVGKIFLPFALTVVCSLLSSLVVALTVVPVLAWWLLARAQPDGMNDVGMSHVSLDPLSLDDASHVTPRLWQRRYRHVLNWCLSHKAGVLGGTTLVFVSSLVVLPLAGSTFIPESHERYATIRVTMPVGTSRNVTDAKARHVERIVAKFGSTVKQMNTEIGNDPGQTGSSGQITSSNTASIFLQLASNTNVSRFTARLRAQLNKIAAPAVIQVKEMVIGGASGSFSIIVTGSDLATIAKSTRVITHAMKHIPGLTNVENNLSQTQPEVRVVPNVSKAASYGLTSYQVGDAVQSVLSRQKVGTMTFADQTYDINTALQPDRNISDLMNLRNLPIYPPTGQVIRLADIARVEFVNTPVSVLHRNNQPFAQVTADFTTQNTGRTTRQALQAISKLALPAGVATSLSGDSQEQNQSFTELVEAILVAVGMVYIVMLIAFGGWAAPLSILFSMPVALIGAFFGTVLGHQPISVSSLIGILMLMGIVVTNAIVLVDRVELGRQRGLTVRAALLEAGTTRLRPILMTAIATVCALVPLALGFAEGALISQGLAVVVIGGLVTSTVLTLVIVPIVYELLHIRIHHRELPVENKT